MIGTYQYRAVRIDAVQWDGTRRSEDEIAQWARPRVRGSASGGHLTVVTHHGHVRAKPGDWIIKRAGGQLECVPAADFAELYEAVSMAPDVCDSGLVSNNPSTSAENPRA